MKTKIVAGVGILLLGVAGWVLAQTSGAETVIFEKGKMPQVTFPHHQHQKTLEGNCNACHDLFPMTAGAIKDLINREKLKKQQVMNEKCLQCHKDRVKAGLSAGPVKCTECHVRP